jgi:hypothetical protein
MGLKFENLFSLSEVGRYDLFCATGMLLSLFHARNESLLLTLAEILVWIIETNSNTLVEIFTFPHLKYTKINI